MALILHLPAALSSVTGSLMPFLQLVMVAEKTNPKMAVVMSKLFFTDYFFEFTPIKRSHRKFIVAYLACG
jgi:hypothetical protein